MRPGIYKKRIRWLLYANLLKEFPLATQCLGLLVSKSNLVPRTKAGLLFYNNWLKIEHDVTKGVKHNFS